MSTCVRRMLLNPSVFGTIVADRKHASTYSPVAFRSVHTGIEPPFLLKIYYAITACMTQGFTSNKISTKREMINCQKFTFFAIFNNKFCHYRSARIERD